MLQILTSNIIFLSYGKLINLGDFQQLNCIQTGLYLPCFFYGLYIVLKKGSALKNVHLWSLITMFIIATAVRPVLTASAGSRPSANDNIKQPL
jgi:hypothetical protein